jgi:hypothetical protein
MSAVPMADTRFDKTFVSPPTVAPRQGSIASDVYRMLDNTFTAAQVMTVLSLVGMTAP